MSSFKIVSKPTKTGNWNNLVRRRPKKRRFPAAWMCSVLIENMAVKHSGKTGVGRRRQNYALPPRRHVRGILAPAEFARQIESLLDSAVRIVNVSDAR